MNIGLSAGLSIDLGGSLSIGPGAGIEEGLVPVSKQFTIMQGCQKV